MTHEEQMKKDALRFLNCQLQAQKLIRKQFNSTEGIHVLEPSDNIQIVGIVRLCELLDIPYERSDWSGNKHCQSDWDIIFFYKNGYKFFELVHKENNDERK